MRIGIVVLGTTIALLSSAIDTRAQSSRTTVYGFSVGAAYTPDDDLTNIGWNVAGTLERLVGDVCELRGTFGVIGLEGDIQGQQPKATYIFLSAEVLAADVFAPTGGIGLYYVDLDPPLLDEAQSSLELGINAGVRLSIPSSNHRARDFAVDARVHSVFGDGPSLLFTLGAGLRF